jgi:FRG domain
MLTQREEYREQDRALMHAAFPVIYALVFRGQTAEYVDTNTGKPLLLPSALRPNARPAWVHRGSPGFWHEIPLGQDLDSGEQPLTEGERGQITAFRRGLTAYGLELLHVGADPALWARIEAWPRQPDTVEEVLDRIALYSRVVKVHDCVLTNYGYAFPPLRALLRDLATYHDLERVVPLLSGDAMRLFITAGYMYRFLQLNVSLRTVAIAVLQHYGLPTRALDVTHDPTIALWFALNRVKRMGAAPRHERCTEEGYVYALWVPVTYDWTRDQGRYYRWARTRGQGLERLLSPLEPALFADLSASLSMLERDPHTRATRQRAALLTGLIRRADWPANAYAEYLVAKLIVSPQVLAEREKQSALKSFDTDYLFPSPAKDRLLNALSEAGVEGLEMYA